MTERELNPRQSVAVVVNDPDLRADAVAALPSLVAAAAPCGSKAVIAELTRLVPLYGVSDRREAEWQVFWGFYVEALGNLPLEALKEGVRSYVAKPDSEFFPKPGPLLALCTERANKVWEAKRRVQIAAEAKPMVELQITDEFRYLDYLLDVQLVIHRRERGA